LDEPNKITSMKLHPKLPYLYIGSSSGKIQLFDLEDRSFVLQIQYSEKDEFGEEIEISTPVLELDNSPDWNYIYAFMAKAAYCIDLRDHTIFSKIPIDEPVVTGTINKDGGNIAILTESGYLSNWSPKFESRIGFFQLEPVDNYVKMIFSTPDQLLISYMNGDALNVNFKENYLQNLKEYDRIDYLLTSGYFDSNNKFMVHLDLVGKINVTLKIDNIVPKDLSIYTEPAVNSNIKDLIKRSSRDAKLKFVIRDISERGYLNKAEKQYIPDERITRGSRDRFLAARDVLKSESLSSNSFHNKLQDENPELTLHHALKSNYEGDKSVETLDVIVMLCSNFDFQLKHARLAWLLNERKANGLVVLALRLKKTEEDRNTTISYLKIFVTISIFFILLYLDYTEINRFSLIILAIPTIVLPIVLYKWFTINKEPIIPKINLYKEIIIFNLAGYLIFLFYLLYKIIDNYTDFINF
jgi:hypothetical protein